MYSNFVEIFKRKKVVFIIICVFFLGAAALIIRPSVQTVFSSAKSQKRLPIYCVDTPDKKVSISFDAACGAGIYSGNYKERLIMKICIIFLVFIIETLLYLKYSIFKKV